MFRVHRLVKTMDNPRRRRKVRENLYQKPEDIDEGYLTYREIVRMVKEKNKDKHKL